jgi:hypothetical protein
VTFAAAFAGGWRSRVPPPGNQARDQAATAPNPMFLVLALQNELAARTGEISRLRAELATRASAIECKRLQDEIRHLRGLLARQQTSATDAIPIIRRVWRVAARHIHPDHSPSGETGKQACERIFKAVKNEVDALMKTG